MAKICRARNPWPPRYLTSARRGPMLESNMTNPTTTLVCDCGHPPTPSAYSSGYATTPEGRTLCYACADAAQVAELATVERPLGYLQTTPIAPGLVHYNITTWTGGILCANVEAWRVRHNIGGYIWHWRGVDAHGNAWFGTSPGPGMYARMRKARKPRRVGHVHTYAIGSPRRV